VVVAVILWPRRARGQAGTPSEAMAQVSRARHNFKVVDASLYARDLPDGESGERIADGMSQK
jgi:hypothetical protein